MFFRKRPNINDAVEEMRGIPGAVLLDVRSRDEYRQGHIPGAVNVPVENISEAPRKIKKKDAPVYCYCLSGARSNRAVNALRSLGYTDVRNIGGINRYRGELE